jgi:hypothetical protein|tara:strand:+ start:3420 stop:3752 length:333 start_codon:yes stop_codon:yes gene_type:complete
VEELIKKYLKILIAIYVFAYLSSEIIAYIFPNLLSIEKENGQHLNIGAGYLRTGIRYFLNVLLVFVLAKEMKFLNLKSSLILIVTCLSNIIGVAFFLLLAFDQKYLKNEK